MTHEMISPIHQNDTTQLCLNAEISFNEFKVTLTRCKSKSPGPDDIPFSFIHHLPYIGKLCILTIYKIIWNSNIIPPKWKTSFTLPIHKSNKDKFFTSRYRPISLLNIMYKLIETIVNFRLMSFIEKINYFSPINVIQKM